jgi:hypothetical protein
VGAAQHNGSGRHERQQLTGNCRAGTAAGMTAVHAAGLAHRRLEIAAVRSAQGPACGRRQASGRVGSAPAGGGGGGAGAQERVGTTPTAAVARWQPAMLTPSAPRYHHTFCSAAASLTSSSSCPASLFCRLGCCSCSWRGTRPEKAHRCLCSFCNCMNAKQEQPSVATAVENRAGREQGRQAEWPSRELQSGLPVATAAACATCMHCPHWHCQQTRTHLLRRKHPLRCSDDIIRC